MEGNWNRWDFGHGQGYSKFKPFLHEYTRLIYYYVTASFKKIEVVFNFQKIEVVFHLKKNGGRIPFTSKGEVVLHLELICCETTVILRRVPGLLGDGWEMSMAKVCLLWVHSTIIRKLQAFNKLGNGLKNLENNYEVSFSISNWMRAIQKVESMFFCFWNN